MGMEGRGNQTIAAGDAQPKKTAADVHEVVSVVLVILAKRENTRCIKKK